LLSYVAPLKQLETKLFAENNSNISTFSNLGISTYFPMANGFNDDNNNDNDDNDDDNNYDYNNDDNDNDEDNNDEDDGEGSDDEAK
jgi:hypothetical protein